MSNIIQEVREFLETDGPWSEGIRLARLLDLPAGRTYSTLSISTLQFQELRKQLSEALEFLDQGEAAQAFPDRETISDKGGRREIPAPKQVIKKLKEQAKALHKKQSMLHGQLSVVKTDEERYEIARQIMEEVIPDLDRLYDEIREIEQTGEVIAVHARRDFYQGIELEKKRHSIRSSISRFKRLLREQPGDPVKEQEYRKKILLKEKELAELERKRTN